MILEVEKSTICMDDCRTPLFILTWGVGRVLVEGKKVLVGVENFFALFACFCGRKKELRKSLG